MAETTKAAAAESAADEALVRGYRKARRGYVVSEKKDQTTDLQVGGRVKPPLYGQAPRRPPTCH